MTQSKKCYLFNFTAVYQVLNKKVVPTFGQKLFFQLSIIALPQRMLSLPDHENSYIKCLIDLLAILKKNVNRTTFVYILKNFRMCTIAVEA